VSNPAATLYIAAILAGRLDAANGALIEVKRQLETGNPRVAIAQTVDRIADLLSSEGEIWSLPISATCWRMDWRRTQPHSVEARRLFGSSTTDYGVGASQNGLVVAAAQLQRALTDGTDGVAAPTASTCQGGQD
jgi:hypothetical protein